MIDFFFIGGEYFNTPTPPPPSHPAPLPQSLAGIWKNPIT